MADKKSTSVPGKKKKGSSPQNVEEPKFQLSKINEFTADVKTEFGKITWPDRKHTFASTAVVIVLVTIISFYLGAVDLILGKLIGFVLN